MSGFGSGTFGDLDAPKPLVQRINDRVEHDLIDSEIALMIAEAQATITDRYGPPANPASPITVTVDGSRRRLDLVRPIDVAQAVTVSERVYGWSSAPAAVLSTDYIVRNGGRTLDRITTSTSWRGEWGAHVTVTYTPVDDSVQRDEVTIGLVQLGIDRLGVKRREAGDVKTEAADYEALRNALLLSLAPRRGGLLLR